MLGETHPVITAETRVAESALPIAVRRAMAWAREQPPGEVTLFGLTNAAGVGARTLQQAWRREVGMSPLAWVRQYHLACARQDLLAADPTTVTVTDVALRWGWANFGRFSAEYRKAYDESPARTLRR